MTYKELQERQKWPLQQKIDHSLYVIEAFLAHYSRRCYTSWSGGKDSTVLLDLVRMINKDIPAVFVNTGNEWPEIIEFVRKKQKEPGYNIVELHPKKTPRQVWAECGFPLISKETANKLRYMKYKPDSTVAKVALSENTLYNCPKKWRFLAEQPFDVSERCCSILKEGPAGCYQRTQHRMPIIGTMASESMVRATTYIHRGGATLSGITASLCRSLSGRRRIFGLISSRETWISPRYTGRE